MRPLLCALVILLLLCACSSNESGVKQVEYGGKTFVVDTEAGTITFDDQVYRYEGSGKSAEFTYPDGSTFWWRQQGNMGHGGWSADYDLGAHGYISGDTLLEVLRELEPSTVKNGEQFLAGVVLVLVGAVNAIAPAMVWAMSYGWRFKNAEPSDAALVIYRFGGIVACVIGAFLVLFSF